MAQYMWRVVDTLICVYRLLSKIEAHFYIFTLCLLFLCQYGYRDRDDIERGLKLLFSLIKNKTFLLTFIRTLEGRKDFTIKEKVNVASLISVALQTQMEYSTEWVLWLHEILSNDDNNHHHYHHQQYKNNNNYNN